MSKKSKGKKYNRPATYEARGDKILERGRAHMVRNQLITRRRKQK